VQVPTLYSMDALALPQGYYFDHMYYYIVRLENWEFTRIFCFDLLVYTSVICLSVSFVFASICVALSDCTLQEKYPWLWLYEKSFLTPYTRQDKILEKLEDKFRM
jgi:hypothetical protein